MVILYSVQFCRLPSIDWISQEQNPSYEQHNLCRWEGDGNNSYLVTVVWGLSVCTVSYGVGSPKPLQACSTTLKSCIIICFCLLIQYCLLPLWEFLVLSMVTLNILQIHLGLYSQNCCAYLEALWLLLWSWRCLAVCVRCGEGLGSQWLPSRSLAPEEAPGQGCCCSAQDQAHHLQSSTIPSSCVSEDKSCSAAWPVEGGDHCRASSTAVTQSWQSQEHLVL